MNRLDGKRAVITGAGSGLGRSLALVLARRGCRIGIADINPDGAGETLEMVEKAGGSGETFVLDVAVPGEVEAMAEHFFGTWQGVDLLVNNAGVVSAGFVDQVKPEDWQWIVGINYLGVVYGCHFFIPRFKAQGGGYILNVASAMGFMNLVELAPYNNTKAAVISLSETLKWELSPHKIGVTVLCPMFFSTHLLDDMRYEDRFEVEFSRATFEHARMTSEEVAEAAVRAVEKGRLYCIPQHSGKFFWMGKRISPTFMYKLMALINRSRMARSFYLFMARRGLLQ